MGPNQRHSRPARATAEQAAFGQVRAVPHLFRYKSSDARLLLNNRCKFACGLKVAARNLIMRAFSCKHRPSTTDAAAVEWLSVVIFAVMIVVISMPHRPRRCLGLEIFVDILDRLSNFRIVGGAEPEPYKG